MNENDAMRLLAAANPVQPEDLGSAGLPDLARRPRPRGRVVLAIAAIAIACGTAAGIAILGVSHSSPPRPVSEGPTGGKGPTGPAGPPPATVARPLLSGSRVTLAEAAAAVGQRVVLPDSALVSPDDVGPVWAWSRDTRGVVAVTYPAERLWVDYERPDLYNADPLRWFTGLAKELRGSHVIRLGGVPALFIRGNDGTGNNDLMFESNGLVIDVTGPYDEATLKAVARSIVDRSPSTVNRPGLNLLPVIPPRKPVSLRTASRRLGVPIPLPGLRLLKRSTAGEGWAEGTCPPRGRKGCMIWIPFPAESVSIVYQRPSPWPRTLRQYRIEAKHRRVSRVVELHGVPAWEVPPNVDHHYPGSISFRVGGARVIVSGHRTAAWLEAIARSIVDRARAKR